MKESKKSAWGSLFYTFGTVMLMAVVAVCMVNYSRDGRAFQMSVLSAVTGTPQAQSTAGAINSSDDYRTIKYKKATAKSSSKSTSTKSSKSTGSKSAAGTKTATTPAVQPAADP